MKTNDVTGTGNVINIIFGAAFTVILLRELLKRSSDPAYTMPVEFENGIKSAVLPSRLHDAGRILRISVSKTAKFVILPASCKNALCRQNFMSLSSQG